MKTSSRKEDVFVGRVACRYIRAVIIRGTFMVHALLTLWKVYLVKREHIYWWLGLLILVMPVEALVTLKVKKGGEWQWFCPSFFFFLLSVVPSIWILELDRLTKKLDCLCSQNNTSNATIGFQDISPDHGFGVQLQSLIGNLNHSHVTYNVTDERDKDQFRTEYPTYEGQMTNESTGSYNNTAEVYSLEQTTLALIETSLREEEVTVKSNLSSNVLVTTKTSDFVNKIGGLIELGESDTWVTALEQTMLYLLILGRWFLPRGNMSHDKLSQLLFVYIGMASDIMELFYLFDEDAVVRDGLIGYIILTAWSVSLLQFTLILTATSAKKRKVMHTIGKVKVKGHCCHCTHNEIWAILVTVFLQDAPFLTIRLYVAIGLHVFTYSLLFFTIKNGLVILLQIYRMMVVCLYDGKQDVKKKGDIEGVELTLNNSMYSMNNSKESITTTSRDTRDIYGTFYKRMDIAKAKDLKLGVAPLAADD